MAENKIFLLAELNYADNDTRKIILAELEALINKSKIDLPHNALSMQFVLKIIKKVFGLKWLSLSTSTWEKRFIFASLVSIFLILIIFIFLEFYPTKLLRSLILFSSLCFIFSFFGFLSSSMVKSFKTSKPFPQRILKELKENSIVDYNMAQRIATFASSEELKNIELDLKYFIEKQQERDKWILNSFLPTLILLGVILSVYILGIEVNPPEKQLNLLYGAISGVSGLVAFIYLLSKLFLEAIYEEQNASLKRCLLVLQKAQSLVNKFQSNQDTAQFKQSKNQQSIMSKLRSIKIDAPSDFAANHDLYLSGEKRIDTDIR